MLKRLRKVLEEAERDLVPMFDSLERIVIRLIALLLVVGAALFGAYRNVVHGGGHPVSPNPPIESSR